MDVSGSAHLHSFRRNSRGFEASTESDPGRSAFRGTMSEDRAAIDGMVTFGPDSYVFHLERDDAGLGVLASASESIGEFDDGFAGRWHGKLPDADEHSWLQMVLRRTSYGLTGVRENWGMNPLIRKIAADGRSIRIEMPTGAVFEGIIDSDGMNIIGVWSDGGTERPFTLRRYIGDPGLGHLEAPSIPEPRPHPSRDREGAVAGPLDTAWYT